jgi:putative spermidine/putrescine transport system substrate-binding protein
MGQYYHDVTTLAAGEGQPVRSTFPKEGGILDSGCWAVSRASKKTEESHVFINYMCQPEVQALMSRHVGTSPTVQRALTGLSDKEFAAVSSEIDPIVPRYDLHQTRADWLNEKWTQLIAG